MIITFCNPLFPLFKDINVGVLTNENSLIVKMNEEPDRKQSKKLIFETFKKWPFKKDFSAERDEQSHIMSLVCKVCCDSLAHLLSNWCSIYSFCQCGKQ